MSLLFLFLLSINNDKIVKVRFTDNPPIIDGFIEELWDKTDSAYNFVQLIPYEKEPASERTVVYVLQDRENLYFAFRCYAEEYEPIASLSGMEDNVKIYIDPFGSKTTAYYFTVFASGIFDDGWLLDDGRTRDNSWDGVWYYAVKLYKDHYEVEVKVPFKSIRYRKGLDEWGLQFSRFIANNQETDYWRELSQLEMDMVSKFGRLKEIEPHASGHYFELYPEGFVRFDKYEGEGGKLKPRMSLNFKWDLTSQATINATINPDFAQIESDPYTLNLSRYPVYLSERRPFFLEGKDIFRFSDFGQFVGFFKPLNIFYSREIGKSMNGEPVPILGGLKFTNKSENWNLGALGAYTDEYSEKDSLIEPRRSFGVLRAKGRLFENSDIGMLFSGTMVDRNDYNYAIGLDGVYRKGFNQFILQGALSDKNAKKGWVFSSAFFGLLGDFGVISSAEVVQDSFDVSDIGFVPWAGRKKFMLICGPFKTYPKGFLRNSLLGPGIVVIREPGDENYSKLGVIEINANFRNNWGFDLSFSGGPYYEADTNYLARGMNLSVWGNGTKYSLNFGGNYGYSYNYGRGFLAYQGSNWLSGRYTILPQLSLSLSSNIWVEWDPSNTLLAITPRLTPRISFKINANMSLEVFNEFVMKMPETDFKETELLSNRVALLFSWNFRPKSWLYIAINDYREQNEEGSLQFKDRIGAIKAKYLFYF